MDEARLVVWLGLSVGAVAGELSWRALAPIAGGPRAPRPPARLVVGLSVMFGSALAMVWMSFQPGFVEIPKTTWENGLLAWVASLSWVGVKVFEAITSGAIQRLIRASGLVFSAVVSLLVLVGLVDTLQMWLDSFSAASLAVCAVNSVALVAILARWRFPVPSTPSAAP